jgi:hypothetical protein
MNSNDRGSDNYKARAIVCRVTGVARGGVIARAQAGAATLHVAYYDTAGNMIVSRFVAGTNTVLQTTARALLTGRTSCSTWMWKRPTPTRCRFASSGRVILSGLILWTHQARGLLRAGRRDSCLTAAPRRRGCMRIRLRRGALAGFAVWRLTILSDMNMASTLTR